MTGSGKTGLCLALLEEAAIDGIPAIVIDPRGTSATCCSRFRSCGPRISSRGSTRPRRTRAGVTPARATPRRPPSSGRKGLAEWGQDAARIQRLRDAVDMAIYTPGSSAGLPLTVLRSFAAPPASDARQRRRHARARSRAAASGLLGPAGHRRRSAQEPRAHPAVEHPRPLPGATGKSLDMAALIRAIQIAAASTRSA